MQCVSLMKKDKGKKQKTPEIPDNNTSEKIVVKKSFISNWIVFLFSISIILISLVSVIFPVLIASNNSTIKELEEFGIKVVEINPFTLGVWAVPFFVSNFIIFGIGVLYFKKRLPKAIKNSIDFIFSFELSKKVALVSIVILLSIFVVLNAGDLTTEEEWEDYSGVKKRIENWSPDQITSGVEPHVRYFLLWASLKLFGYYTIIPFIASMSLLLLTYFFTLEISQKRFAGIIAMIILIQSNVFLEYVTTVSYTNFWILFYLLSLYLIYKAWPLSPIVYILSILAKAINVMFLPMSIFFILSSKIPKIKKIIIAGSMVGLILAATVVAFGTNVDISGVTGSQEDFDVDEFWLGFTSFSYQLRFDGLLLIFILALTVGLFIASRHNIQHADSLMVLISGILFSAPILTGFTEQTNQPYRFVPLVVFFAIGVGVLLSKRKN